MMTRFNKTYWDDHWAPNSGPTTRTLPPNPYLQSETADLHPTTAFDAGCGAGVEAVWLAERGWRVTAADISSAALATARNRATAAGLDENVTWVEADLSRWEPAQTWDLVVTNYAHSSIDQLAFYQRIASWVAPGGTLLIVGHLHDSVQHGHAHPKEATVTLADVTSLFTYPEWDVEASCENNRIVYPGGNPVQLRDAIIRAHRLP